MSASKLASHRTLVLLLTIFCLGLSITAQAQSNGVDPTFNAVPSNPLTAAESHMVQPDGKVLVFGTRSVVDGVAKSDMFRLNTDGTTDATFDYCGCGVDSITGAELLPDGRILATGRTGTIGKIIRLNANGSIDPTFLVSMGATPFGSTDYFVDAIRPDGKFYVTRRDSAFGNVHFGFYRYNADGTVDSTFTAMTLASGSPASAFVRLALLADGRFYLALTSGVGGTFSTLRRHNADGSVDATWDPPAFSTPGFPPQVFISDLALNADGSLLVTGRFNTVNGADKPNLVKLLPAGNVDLIFSVPNVFFGSRVYVLPDEKILFAGNIDIGGIVKIYRLNSNGTVDNTFTMDPSVTGILSQFDVDSTLRIIVFGQTATGIKLVRLLSNGSRDFAFDPKIALYGSINAAAVQTDGKVLLAGVFTEMNGTARTSFARVNADGSFDPTFNPGTAFDQPPDAMIVQPDGKILAIGSFTNYDGAGVSGIVRINTNGTRDGLFNPAPSSRPTGISLEPDGQILICGNFSSVNGVGRTGVARLNSDGSLDNSFNPIIGSANLAAVLVQADGKIMIGGFFSGVNGFNRSNLARLLADGSLDETFNASGVAILNIIRIQPDGKYLYATTTNIYRRNVDGTNDSGFVSPTFSTGNSDTRIHAIDVRSDGSILVGGRFNTADLFNRRNLARLGPNGAFDVLFIPDGANNRVRTLVPYSTSKVIVGGDFTVIGNVSKSGVARLDIAPFRGRTPFDFNGDGRADYTVYRPSTGTWYQLFSNGDPYAAPTFGLPGDLPVPADYDGDGKTDVAIWRPSNGDWWYISSVNGAQVNVHFGATGDIPMPSDVDGDGKTDFVVYRPSTRIWYRLPSTTSQQQFSFGLAGDQPVIGDFDGDGKGDLAIFRPSNGDWWYAASSAGFAQRSVHWGATGDIPAPADYDGDGKTDFAVFRPSNGGWYVLRSSDQSYLILGFGLDGDRPVPADYDGDGKADIAVFRPSTGVWYLIQSTAGSGGVQWGVSTDVAIPNAFLTQ